MALPAHRFGSNTPDLPKSLRPAHNAAHGDAELLGRRTAACSTKKTGDKGIDGRMYFETKEGLKCMVLSVKGGGIRPTDLRDLRGVLERDHDMAMAGFCSHQHRSSLLTSHPVGLSPHPGSAFGTGELQEGGATRLGSGCP
jgi:hypothetical protein